MDYEAIIYVKKKNWLGEGALELLAFKVFDIDYRQPKACCAAVRAGTFLFAPSLVIIVWP